MKTSHKSDELKKIEKAGGPQIGYLWYNPTLCVPVAYLVFNLSAYRPIWY